MHLKRKSEICLHKNEEVFHNLFEFELPGHQISTIECVILLPTGDAGRVTNLVKIE